MNKIIFIARFVFNFIIIIFAVFLIMRISVFPEKIKNIVLAENISQTVLQFNVENFHTQLEMWEYAYDPDNERLTAFEMHNLAINDDAEKLIDLVANSQNVLYKDGLVHSEKIISDLRQVQEDWTHLLSIIKNYSQTLESNASDEQIKTAKETMDTAMFANEALFDRLEFNKEIQLFSTSQSKYAEGLVNEINLFLTFSKIGISILFILLITGVSWSSWSYLKLNKKIFSK